VLPARQGSPVRWARGDSPALQASKGPWACLAPSDLLASLECGGDLGSRELTDKKGTPVPLDLQDCLAKEGNLECLESRA